MDTPPSDFLTLETLDQLRALADPLRQRILEAFCTAPMTTKQVAKQLGEKPTKLYHHVEILEETGLIRLVETRQNRGTIEKYFQAVAKQFIVDHDLLSLSGPSEDAIGELQGMVINTLQEGLAEARQRFSIAHLGSTSHQLPLVLAQRRIRASQAQIEKLSQSLQAWLAECKATQHEESDVEYALTLAFYPVQQDASEAPE